MTVKALRQANNKVRVVHYRIIMVGGEPKEMPRYELKKEGTLSYCETKGGRTIVEIDSKDGKHYQAEAVCSKKDNFCYKRGVAIALGRVMAQINLPF